MTTQRSLTRSLVVEMWTKSCMVEVVYVGGLQELLKSPHGGFWRLTELSWEEQELIIRVVLLFTFKAL